MILRVVKAVVLIVLLSFVLPWFLVDVRRLIRIQWQIGQKTEAILGCVLGCTHAVFLLALIASFWSFGERHTGGGRAYKPRHGELIVYSILPTLIMALSETYPFNHVRISDMVSWAHLAATCLGTTAIVVTILVGVRLWWNKDRKSVYGLQHGRLHLDTQVPMWMNMGYWKVSAYLYGLQHCTKSSVGR